MAAVHEVGAPALRKLLLAACCLLLGSPAAVRAEENDTAARNERLQEMRRRAADLIVKLGPPSAAATLQPNTAALLRFNDATREFHDGTLWAYCDRGRPCLMVSIEKYDKFWSHELISLTERELVVEAGDWTWQPQEPLVKPQPIVKAEEPAGTAEGRSRQARALARRFSAVEFLGDDQERIELRMQSRPILIYTAAELGVETGMLFVLSNGTNPEVLLMLEAVRKGESARWQYAFARISTAALEGALDGERVWGVDHSKSPRNQTAYSYYSVEIGENP